MTDHESGLAEQSRGNDELAHANFKLAYAAVQADGLLRRGKMAEGQSVLSRAVDEHSRVLERLT